MISENPLKMTAPWKCEKCSAVESAPVIIARNNVVKNEFLSLNQTYPMNYEMFLKRHEKSLHATHSYVLEAKLILTHLYGNAPGFSLKEMNDCELNRKIELLNQLLDVASLLQPGITKFRGKLLLELQKFVAVKLVRDVEAMRITNEEFQVINT